MKPISRQDYLNLTPQEQAKFCKVMECGVEKYFPRAFMQPVSSTAGNKPYFDLRDMPKTVTYTPGEIPKFPTNFAIMDDPQLPIEVDIAFIEGFLSSNQYLTQSRRFRNIQISHNQQQREIETLKKTLNKCRELLKDSEHDVQHLVGQNNKQLADIQNLKAELAELKKKSRAKRR